MGGCLGGARGDWGWFVNAPAASSGVAGGGDPAPWRLAAVTAVGGACGSLARGGVQWIMDTAGWPPWGAHVAMNLLGGVLMGALFARLSARDSRGAPLGIPSGMRVREHLLAAGFLGGLTTVSGFAWDVVNLVEGGDAASAALVLSANAFVGIAACFASCRLIAQTRRPASGATASG